MSFYLNGTSFKLKEIIPTYDDFVKGIDEYNYFADYVEFTTARNQVLYYMLMTNYANSYIRQETPDLFFSDFINIFVENYNKYFKLFETIQSVYNASDLLIDETETTNETTTNSSEGTGTAKSADTPTVVNPDTQFDEDYSNVASTSKTNASFSEEKTFARAKDYNIVDSLNNALTLTNFKLRDFAQDFACLFVQIDNPVLDLIYTGDD